MCWKTYAGATLPSRPSSCWRMVRWRFIRRMVRSFNPTGASAGAPHTEDGMTRTPITITATRVDDDRTVRREDADRMDHWQVVLQHDGRQMTTYFSMGAGCEGRAPTAEEVLECVLSDAAMLESTQDFEDWAAELGVDPDSRKVKKRYHTVQTMTERLKTFLGDEYRERLNAAPSVHG